MAMQKILSFVAKRNCIFEVEIFYCSCTEFFFFFFTMLNENSCILSLLEIMVKNFKETRMKIVSWQTIAKKLRISRSSIWEILSKFQGTESVSDQSKCDCPKMLQHRMVWKLIRRIKTHLKKTGNGQLGLVQFGATKCITWEYKGVHFS